MEALDGFLRHLFCDIRYSLSSVADNFGAKATTPSRHMNVNNASQKPCIRRPIHFHITPLSSLPRNASRLQSGSVKSRPLHISPPSVTCKVSFVGKSPNGGLTGPCPWYGLFIVGGLYMFRFAIGLGLPGTPTFLVASSCGLTILVLAEPETAAAPVWVEPGTCFNSLVRGMVWLWLIPGVFRIDGLSACGLKAGKFPGNTGGGPSVSLISGNIVAALAEKKPLSIAGGAPILSADSSPLLDIGFC